MRILIVLDSKIPAHKYGGTQRVIWYLGKELAKMGHTVAYLVPKGSVCDFGQVIFTDPSRPLEKQIPAGFDIVHFNAELQHEVPQPHIVTIHGNSPAEWTQDINTVFVSRDHAERFHSRSFVYNGLDWDDYGAPSLSNPRSYYHFLGKAAWRVKNLKGAISVVEAMKGERLYVLGGNRLNLKMGMRLTLNPRIRFFGMVGGERKNRLLQGSKGLIFPVRWHEPFGLAITESLFFGAPVFGTPYGSLPELVPSEVGFLTDSSHEMARRILQGGYDPALCHQYARDLFNSRIMAERYIQKYETVLAGRTLNEVVPWTDSARETLPWR